VAEGQAGGGTSGGGEAQALAVANAIASGMPLETMRFERNEKYCSQKPVKNGLSLTFWTMVFSSEGPICAAVTAPSIYG
jgi:hypothetical protein